MDGERQCRFCDIAIRLGDEDAQDNILVRGEEIAHRTCVFDRYKSQEKGMASGWRAIQWWGFGHGGAAGALGRTPEEPE
jgi:hypothetical protein